VRALRAAQRRLACSDGSVPDTNGELAELAGWLLHDAGQHDAARAMNYEALHLARLAGDRSTELLVLNNISYLDCFTGRPAAALRIARSEPVVFGWSEARALAQLGDRAGCLRALDRARD